MLSTTSPLFLSLPLLFLAFLLFFCLLWFLSTSLFSLSTPLFSHSPHLLSIIPFFHWSHPLNSLPLTPHSLTPSGYCHALLTLLLSVTNNLLSLIPFAFFHPSAFLLRHIALSYTFAPQPSNTFFSLISPTLFSPTLSAFSGFSHTFITSLLSVTPNLLSLIPFALLHPSTLSHPLSFSFSLYFCS